MSRLISLLFSLAIVLLAVPAAHAQIYVDKGAPGANDGTSWFDAYTDLQTAIDNASPSSEIWIARGVYTPDSEGDSFTITGNIDGVRLYGGFDGSESSRSARQPKIHRTILSGDLNGDDTDPDGDGIIEDADPDQDGRPENLQGGENAHHVLLLDGGNRIGADVGGNVTRMTVIDGVVITAGQADGGALIEGGGLLCDGYGDTNECSPTLQNVVFVGNAASRGGALFDLGEENGTSSPRIKNAVFVGNAANGRGGAIYNNGRFGGTASPEITNALFTKNASGDTGGAIFNVGSIGESRPSITNATFTGNTTAFEGGAISNEEASPDVTNTILWGNRAGSGGDEIGNIVSSVSLSHSIVQDGDEGIGNGTGFSDGSENLDKNPQFVDAGVPAGPDEVFGTIDDGTNIYISSPAVDAGENFVSGATEDLTGAPRRQDIDGDGTATVNIGAYEPAQTPPPPTADAVAPSAPYPGHPVQITGSDFIGVSEVTYNGTPVAFTVESETTIRARVPNGATTDASFEITTPGGTDTSPQVSPDTRPGLYGPRRTLAFDGSGDYVATGASGSALGLVNESFSVGAWFKVNSLTNNRTVVGMDNGASNKALHILVNSDGTLKFGFWSNDLTTTSSVIQTGKWYHATIVYDASRTDGQNDRFLYLNGKQVAADETSSDFKGDKELLIGRLDGSRYFDGQIDQVRVWKGALTQGEVRERAYQTVGPGEAAFSELEAAYRFDAGGTTTAFEQTENYRFGTFEGDPTRQAVSGARLGQEAVSTTGSDATVGPSGGSLSATGVSASSGASVQLYRFGSASGPLRDGSAAGDDLSRAQPDRRSALTWGVAATESPSATLTIDYSGVQGLPGAVTLLRRSGPGAAWQSAAGWSRDEAAQTFTTSGTVPTGQYAVAPTRIYVDKDAGGASNGASWTDAYTDLQTAIDNASSSSEIWVAEGTYKPDSEGDSFTITGNKDGIELYGGFESGDAFGDRAPREHRTILSGDLAGDDTDPDGDGIIEDADPNQDGTPENLQGGENAHHVLVLDGGNGIGTDVSADVTEATVIDGVVVTAGQADGSFPNNTGGGLLCDGEGSGNECSPTLRNVVFAGNAADQGGGMYNEGGSDGTASPLLTNTAFTGNAAGQGGGIYNEGFEGTASPSLTNVVFTGNAASVEGGALFNNGTAGTSTPQITNSTLTRNTADFGGAVFNLRAAPDVTNTILWGNRPDSGDEIQNSPGSVSLSHSIVQDGDGGIGNGTGFSDGIGNIDKDPQFYASGTLAGPDGTLRTADDSVNVAPGSPALDAGDNTALDTTGEGTRDITTDITGAPRVQELDSYDAPAVNIGAYEASPGGYSRRVVGTDGTGNDTGWRMLSVPSADRTRADLEDDLDFSVPSGSILYRYENGSWSAKTASSASLPRGTGFMLYFFDDSIDPLTAQGTVLGTPAGSEDQSADQTVSGLDQNQRFHLLGNPYNTAFNLDDLNLAGQGFQTTVQVYDPEAQSYEPVLPTDATYNSLSSWQGLVVERSAVGAGGTNLTFSASGKQSGDGSLIGSKRAPAAFATQAAGSSASAPNGADGKAGRAEGKAGGADGKAAVADHATVRLQMAVTGADGDTLHTSRSVLWLDGRATSQWDPYDATALPPPTDDGYATAAFPISRDGRTTQRILASEPYPSEGQVDVSMPLSVKTVSLSGTGTLSWPDSMRDAVPEGWTVQLRDTNTGETVDLHTDSYTFSLGEKASMDEKASLDEKAAGSRRATSPDSRKGKRAAQNAKSIGTDGKKQSLAKASEARFRLEITSVPQPLEMADFDGRATEEGIVLQWQTTSEQNDPGFTVQRARANQDDWKKIAFVEGAGTTSKSTTYRHTDADLPYAADTLRYRLRQVGSDGSKSFTQPIAIDRGAVKELKLLGTYPNPARRQVTVRYKVPETKEKVTLRIYDVLGRQVRTIQGKSGRHERRLDVSGLGSGVYFLRLRADGSTRTQKLTVVQ
jgi:hypothetical protein